jgi:hypothetical protein
MVHLLPFSFVVIKSKIKAKPSGLPDSNFIFFVATKKTKQKKALRCAGHVWVEVAATSNQANPSDSSSTYPSQDPRLLRASPAVVDCFCGHAFQAFLL